MQDPYDPSQIYIDYSTRYPEYMEPQAAVRPGMMRSYNASSYEDNHQTAQMGYPTKYSCNMGACPDSAWPQKYSVTDAPMLGRATRPGTVLSMDAQSKSEGFGGITLAPELLFMFIVLIIMLALVIKSLSDMKRVLKSIQKSLGSKD